MEGKVLQFENGIEKYRALAEKHADADDLIGALGFLFSALKIERSPAVLMDIADLYADMALYELSNQYWFYYLDIVSEDKASVAYEELAINFFYMGNILASGYYFHLKIQADGYIRQEGLDKEILDFFSEQETRRKAYRVVYPIERADYTLELERAKRALTVGDYEKAVKLYSSVPEGAPQYNTALSELSVATFLADDVDEAIKLSHKLIKENGESISACCNLSSMYAFKGDNDKRDYYFARALSLEPSGLEDQYKLATCSLENGQHQLGIEYLEKVLKERPYDVVMHLFLGLARINIGDYEGAERTLSHLLRIDPFDCVVDYYYRLAVKLKDGGSAGRLLPLKYIALVPSSVEKARIKKIESLFEEDVVKIRSELKKQSVVDLIVWGFSETEPQVAKTCALILAKADNPKAYSMLKDALMNTDVEPDVKRVIIHIIVISGKKDRYGVAARGFYFRFKPKKLPCEKAEDGALYFSAYAVCMSRMIFIDAEHMDKIAFSTDRVYKKLRSVIDPQQATKEEIAGIIASDIKLDGKLRDRDICAIFDINIDRFKKLKRLYNGEENDKDN